MSEIMSPRKPAAPLLRSATAAMHQPRQLRPPAASRVPMIPGPAEKSSATQSPSPAATLQRDVGEKDEDDDDDPALQIHRMSFRNDEVATLRLFFAYIRVFTKDYCRPF